MITFGVAAPPDSPALNRVLRQVPLGGSLSLAYAREPDFFASLAAAGGSHQVLAAREGGAVAGLAVRSVRSLFVNGTARDLGYLHGLRFRPDARGRTALGRGFQYLQRLHREDGRVPAYLATAIADDGAVRSLFAKRRRYFPRFTEWGKFTVAALPLPRRPRPLPRPAGISAAAPEDVPALREYFRAQGSRRQFFPACTTEDFRGFRGFSWNNLYLARRSGPIQATLGLWNQDAFQQAYVQAYRGWFRLARPAVNLALRAWGCAPLPPAGGRLRVLYACFATAATDDPAPLGLLLDRALAEAAGRGYHCLLVGFHERDPLRAVLSRRLAISYSSRLYVVSWDDGQAFCDSVSREMIPYLETAFL